MPFRQQSISRSETINTPKERKNNKKKKKVDKTKKVNESKSQISEESRSATSIKEKIFCYLFCCCQYGKST